MSISKKRYPQVSDPEMNRVISRIYDDINELINAVNQKLTVEDTDRFKGNLGDIRVAQISDKTYEIQGRTKDGWASVELSFKED
tara:strand:- start:293 stop:544 length:252 start_codon:yes stop_codon:yes gene_type:complete